MIESIEKSMPKELTREYTLGALQGSDETHSFGLKNNLDVVWQMLLGEQESLKTLGLFGYWEQILKQSKPILSHVLLMVCHGKTTVSGMQTMLSRWQPLRPVTI